METQQERLRYLLDLYEVTPYRVSKETGVSQSTISRFLSSAEGAIRFQAETIERLSKYFQVSPDWLEYGRGDRSSRESKENATVVDNPEIVYLPIVPYTARAGSLGDYEQLFDDDYSRRQPVLVTKQMHGKYLCFSVGGDSMEPILRPGDVVMARHIKPDLYRDSKLHLRDWSVWIVVTKSEGILIKHIADHDVAGGTLTLHSANPLYTDMTVPMSDVIDIYNAIEIVSRHL